jgi:SlyX protein
MASADVEKRFEDLEVKVAFQEELIQQLDEALISQQQQITELQSQLKILEGEFRTLESQMPDAPEPPPPHY